MTDMLVELIQNFISGSASTLNSIFNSMLNLVFFIERELTYIQNGVTSSTYNVDFNGDVKMLEKEPEVDLFSVASSEFKKAMIIHSDVVK